MNEGTRIARDQYVTGPMTFKLTKDVIEMNIPGFTAEASLFNAGTRYRTTAEAGFHGGLDRVPRSGGVLPQLMMSVPFFDPYTGGFGTFSIDLPDDRTGIPDPNRDPPLDQGQRRCRLGCSRIQGTLARRKCLADC